MPVGLALFFLVGCFWAAASPVGAAPDDDYHLASIWCSGEQSSATCQLTPQNGALVSTAILNASECYRADQVAAACYDELQSGSVFTRHINQIEHMYPSVYYRVMGIFAGEDIPASVMRMRMVNVALGTLLLGLVLWSAGEAFARATRLALVLVMTPLGWFILSSTNPSAWVLLGVGLAWIAAYAWLTGSGARSRDVGSLIALLLGSAMAISARTDGGPYLLVSFVAAVALWALRSRAHPWRLVPVVAIAIAAAAVYVQQSRYPSYVEVSAQPPQDGILILKNLMNVLSLHQGALGGWELGWFDTPVPENVPVIGLFALGLVVSQALLVGDRAKWVAAAVWIAACLAAPMYLLQIMGAFVGNYVQPRYVLPLMLGATIAVCLTARDHIPLELPRRLAWLVVLLTSSAAVLSMWAVAHRYAVGETFGPLDPGPVVWPGLVGWGLYVPFAVGSLCMVGFISWAVLGARGQAMRQTVMVPEPLASA